jgi:hypothetical protein
MDFERLIFSAPCYNFLESLVTQISQGLRNSDGKVIDDLDAMKGAFAKVCLRDDVSLAFVGEVPFKVPNRLLQMQEAYIKSLDKERDFIGRGKLYAIVGLLPTLERKIRKSRLFRPLQVKDKLKGLELAIATAEDNIGRTDDRIAALRFLASTWGMHGWPNRESEAAYGRAYSGLWERRSRFYTNLMRLVLVQGDMERLERLREDVYEQYMKPGMAVMHYLEPEGSHPGGWFSKDEESFRAELKEAIETPLSANV